MNRSIWSCLIVSLFTLVPDAPAAEPVRMIFDTDIGNDVDDVQALALIHSLQSRGQVELLAVTVTKDHELAGPMVNLINTFYGRPNIPIGTVRNGVTREEGKYLGLAREGDRANLPHTLKKSSDAPEATAVLRKVLAAQPDGSVVIVQVGFASNLARLLDTPGDEFSPLGGKELAKKKVKLVSAMFGAFKPDGSINPHKEYNVVEDLPASKRFVGQWPTPIVFSGFEIGLAITTSARSIEQDYNYVKSHPVAEAYRRYSPPPAENPCWDLTSVLYAALPNRDYFGLSTPGQVTLAEDGVTLFKSVDKGPHRFLTLSKEQAIRCREAFVQLCSQPPTTSGK